ncbi:hypothetical protein [Rhodococcus sp. NCIMB 12038]|uniref:hypothetical protein n=1 Tax=Rhodococcus sp. NCIMB 12038 TaxID=933800 RepID=UPI0015C5AE67|nr:hypothetical protein [Rhodococcus sp. NCIMB 12038]
MDLAGDPLSTRPERDKTELLQALFHDILVGVLDESIAFAEQIIGSDEDAVGELRRLVE